MSSGATAHYDLPGADVLTVARLVALRRALRLVLRLSLLALVVRLIVLVSVTGTTSEDSAAYTWFNDHGNRGFVVVLAVLGVAIVLAGVTAIAGSNARTAAHLMPWLRRVPELIYTDGQPHEGSRAAEARNSRPTNSDTLAPAGSTQPERPSHSMTALLVVLLVAFVSLAAYTASSVSPDYQASQGRGGPIVTIKRDSTIVRVLRPTAYDKVRDRPPACRLLPRDAPRPRHHRR